MDYLRQLRNDEKRMSFSMVGTVDDTLADTIDNIPLFVVPKRSTIARIYAVTKVPFAAGSTVTVSIYQGEDQGELLTALPLDTENTITMSPKTDTAARYATDEYVGGEFNQAAVDSAVGEAQIIVEFTEVPVCSGKYSA